MNRGEISSATWDSLLKGIGGGAPQGVKLAV